MTKLFLHRTYSELFPIVQNIFSMFSNNSKSLTLHKMAVKPCTFCQKLITSNKIQHVIKNSIILLRESKQKISNVTDLQQFAQTKLVGNSKTLRQQNKFSYCICQGMYSTQTMFIRLVM